VSPKPNSPRLRDDSGEPQVSSRIVWRFPRSFPFNTRRKKSPTESPGEQKITRKSFCWATSTASEIEVLHTAIEWVIHLTVAVHYRLYSGGADADFWLYVWSADMTQCRKVLWRLSVFFFTRPGSQLNRPEEFGPPAVGNHVRSFALIPFNQHHITSHLLN
jgi:hypothetical protein